MPGRIRKVLKTDQSELLALGHSKILWVALLCCTYQLLYEKLM